MFCPKCGNEIKEGASFCPKCGTKVASNQENFQQNNYKSQNSQQTKNVKKHTMKTISSKNMERTTTFDFGEDLVSGNIKERHFAKFYTLVKREKKTGMLVYLTILLAIVVGTVIWSFPEAISEDGFFSGIFRAIFTAIVLPTFTWCLFQLILNGFGQACMRLIVGASKIERQDMIESITIPVEAIIAEARQNGLTLPDDIKVYQMKTDEAVVYAFGMNSIGVSYAMTELPEEVFKAKVLAELYRIHIMDPDYLLFMLGSNLISIILGLFAIVVGWVYMNFGDRRKGLLTESDSMMGAFLFASSIVCLSAWMGVCFLFIRGGVRANQFEADRYVAQCGYGEALCVYLDNCMPREFKFGLKLLEMGHPSCNHRIAALQNVGVGYKAY